MSAKTSKIRLIQHELRAHLPFTLLGVGVALCVLGLIYFVFIRVGKWDQIATFRNFFHTFHFSHVFISAVATTAVFFRHDRNVLKSILVGFFGTLIPCGISDLLFPFFGGALLGAKMTLHICVLEEPAAVLFSNAAGIAVGLLAEARFGRVSYFSHGTHIFISSLASLFYLVTFGLENWVHMILGIFVVTAVAVVIPCCSSDIVIPISFISGVHGHEHEDEHTQHEHGH